MGIFGILATITTIGYVIYYAVVIFLDLNHKEEKKTGVTETIDTSDFQIEPSKVAVDNDGNVLVNPDEKDLENKENDNETASPVQPEAENPTEHQESEPTTSEETGSDPSDYNSEDTEPTGGGVNNPLSIENAQKALEGLDMIQPDYQDGKIDNMMFLSQMQNIDHNSRIKMKNVSF